MKPLSDLTAQCIRCGFCLETCPTFAETGIESESPRGRIYLVRMADEGKLGWDADVEKHLDLCLGCRACETACPSGVKYGEILELARERMRERRPRGMLRLMLRGMTDFPGLMKLSTGRRIPTMASQALSGEPPEADLPRPQPADNWPPLDEKSLPPVRGEVYLLEGCVMKPLFARVHEATRNLLRRVGYQVRPAKAGCCGALHAHAGYMSEARDKARRLSEAMPGDLPVIVNSAGCGSAMKEYGAWSEGLAELAARTVDITEFLMNEGLFDELAGAPGLPLTATYHDACHLAHGQGIRIQPRQLVNAIPGLRLAEMPEPDMCCGSAGTYNITQPGMARRLLERKWRNVESVQPQVVITGNPGCHSWLVQAARERGRTVRVLHTAEALEAAFWGDLPGED